jgi:high-affinity Fe2+/Pb2+ permease
VARLSSLGEKTFGMVVIARFPRLDPTVAAACPAVPVVAIAATATTTMAPADVAAAVLPSVSVGPAVTRRARAPRARFPAVSTLVLAVVAGMFWMAVWRDEQRRAAEDAERDREAVAMEPDGEAGLIR